MGVMHVVLNFVVGMLKKIKKQLKFTFRMYFIQPSISGVSNPQAT